MIVGSRFEQLDEASRIDELNRLIAQWREPGFVRVKPERVIPDATNRDGTGLSVNHLHYIASNMMKDGFTPRDHATGTGHDLPIFVREHSGKESALGATSLRKWKGAQAENTEYPPARPWQSQHGEEFYCSLGNGHFFQALNLFGTSHRCRFRSDPPPGSVPAAWPETYSTAGDAKLTAAVTQGVEGVVLKAEMPKDERKFVSQMLNAAFEYRWVTDLATGGVRVDHDQEFRNFTSFEGMVKHADAWQLDEIIEMRMKREAAAEAQMTA